MTEGYTKPFKEGLLFLFFVLLFTSKKLSEILQKVYDHDKIKS